MLIRGGVLLPLACPCDCDLRRPMWILFCLLIVALCHGRRPNFAHCKRPRHMLCEGLLVLIVSRCRRKTYPIRCCFRRQIGSRWILLSWACRTWLGHVARMHIPALAKLALWGWPSTSKAGSKRGMQGSWLKAVLAKTSLSARDWFRIAVSRGGQWQAAGRRFFS